MPLFIAIIFHQFFEGESGPCLFTPSAAYVCGRSRSRDPHQRACMAPAPMVAEMLILVIPAMLAADLSSTAVRRSTTPALLPVRHFPPPLLSHF